MWGMSFMLQIVFKFFVKFGLTFPMNNVMIKSDVLLKFSDSNPGAIMKNWL